MVWRNKPKAPNAYYSSGGQLAASGAKTMFFPVPAPQEQMQQARRDRTISQLSTLTDDVFSSGVNIVPMRENSGQINDSFFPTQTVVKTRFQFINFFIDILFLMLVFLSFIYFF